MRRFNLVDEPWIPVRYPDGRREELGVKAVLLEAGSIAEIEDPSPLVVASLHRFLLAALYRALEGPTDIKQARELFTSGFPKERIEAYLAKWHDRFWLFDNTHPFFQIPEFVPDKARSWTALAAEHNADNSKVLFDHVDASCSGEIRYSAAAKWLLATQTFAVSSGKSELAHTSTAPAATGAMVLPVGKSLMQTLTYNLVPQNREILKDDLPVWEREPEAVELMKAATKRTAAGYADLYTWRCRSVIFLSKEEDTGVCRVGFASGVGCVFTELTDPMMGYRLDDKNGLFQMQFKERGIWRDFDSLLPDESNLGPKTVTHSVELAKAGRFPLPQTLLLLGQANDKAKIEYWRMERYALPNACLSDKTIRSVIKRVLEKAEHTQKFLWAACSAYARNILSRGEGNPDKGDVSKFIANMPCLGEYWSMLEARFHRLLERYTEERNSDEIMLMWLNDVREALRRAWEMHRADAASGDAWQIRALVKAEAQIACGLSELNKEITEMESYITGETAVEKEMV